MKFLDQVIYTLNNKDITQGDVLYALVIILVVILLYKLVVRLLLKPLGGKDEKLEQKYKFTYLLLQFFAFLVVVTVTANELGINWVLFQYGDLTMDTNLLLKTVLILLSSWLLIRISHIWFSQYNNQKKIEHEVHPLNPEQGITPLEYRTTIRNSIIVFAVILLIRLYDLDFSVFQYNNINVRLSGVLILSWILMVTRLFSWVLTNIILRTYYKSKGVEDGTQYAINRLLIYVLYVFSFIIGLESIGINMTVIWGGAAALLVGVGLGLQHFFNDFFSGLILLFERPIAVNDWIEIDNIGGRVTKIDLRTTKVLTRENISIIIPNSRLTAENVINWSHASQQIRFTLAISVAYGSNTELVRSILLSIASDNPSILSYPKAQVRFSEFGDSSLNFDLLFWCSKFRTIEDIRSELRFAIDTAFRQNNIEIPFPQRVVWTKNENDTAT